MKGDGHNLPVLPASGALITPDGAVLIERRIAMSIRTVDDIRVIIEWQARADALATYLRHKEGEGPMLGALRRVEARIGELLGPGPDKPGPGIRPHADGIHRERRSEFRTLAEAVKRGLLRYEDDGDESPWHASRRALLLWKLKTTAERIVASTENEWYTPPEYIESARTVLGSIDLDPASTPEANKVIGATTYYTKEDGGLTQPWAGRIWLNPPYGRLSGAFVSRLVEEYQSGNVVAAIMLVNAHCTDTDWFQLLWDGLVCFTDHRIDFDSAGREKETTSTHGSAFGYLGPNTERFISTFNKHGVVVQRA